MPGAPSSSLFYNLQKYSKNELYQSASAVQKRVADFDALRDPRRGSHTNPNSPVCCVLCVTETPRPPEIRRTIGSLAPKAAFQ